MTWAEQLRQAIAKSGLSDSEIAERAGISRQQVFRFRKADRSLTIDTAEAVANAIDFTFKPRTKRKGK